MNIIDEIKEHNMITFLNKEYIDNIIKTNICKCIINKHLINLKNKLLEKNIYLFIISLEDEINIRNDYNLRFNNSDFYNNNELYFKLDDSNENIYRYYTIDKINSHTEEFKQELFYHVITNFGLKTAKLQYVYTDNHNKQINIKNETKVNGGDKFSINGTGGYNSLESSNSNSKIINTRDLENIGSSYFFRCYKSRSFWCDKYYGELKNINSIIKEILDEIEDYSYKSYVYDSQLKDFVISRSNGMNNLVYDISEDKKYKKTYNFFCNIGIEFSKFGFNNNLNIESINEESFIKHKVISAEFYSINELEIKTLTTVLEQNDQIVDDTSLNFLKKKFKELNNKYCRSLNCQLKQLQTKQENNYDVYIDIIKIESQLSEQKDKYNKIILSEKTDHSGMWNTNENTLPYWSCCESKHFESHCKN